MEESVQCVSDRHLVLLRPGVDKWLYDVSSRFILVAYSKTSREFALDMLKLIDPRQRYFDNRFFTVHLTQKNKLSDFVNADGAHTIIMDSSISEWSEADVGSVLTVRPFRFFTDTCLMGPEFDPKSEHELTIKSLKTPSRLDHGMYRSLEVLFWVSVHF